MTPSLARGRAGVRPTLAILSLFAAACAGDPTTGTWAQHDATTPLPDVLVPDTDLAIDATWEMDGAVSPGSFTLTMNLEAIGLTDAIELVGTYERAGSDLTLTFTGFVIDPASGNTSMVREDGAQCITLHGFLDTPVCFQTPQTHAYAVDADTLTVTLDHEIAGVASQTNFTLLRVAE
jgi:hypothetical protein